MKSVFPHRVHCSDTYGWADCPRLSKLVWHRLRLDPNRVPAKLTWYATDLEILSPKSIKLFVYEIEDNFRGGIGDRIFETVVTDFTAEEEMVLQSMITNLYTAAAADELQRREDDERMKKILAVRMEMFGV